MNSLGKKLFAGTVLVAVQPMRFIQYFMNKDAFDKSFSYPGVYELSDVPYVKGQKAPKGYNPILAAMGFGRSHLLDIESPTPLDGTNNEKLPVIVSVHGGGYTTNQKECNRPHAQFLASKGYKVVNVNYRLQPEVEMDGELRDLVKVLEWIRENAERYGFDTDNVFLTGDSSGGHLVLLYTGLQNSEALQEKIGVRVPEIKIRATAATCPVGSFVAKDLVSKTFKNLAGRLYSDDLKLAYSYEGFADATYPEVLIVTTETDVPIHTTTKGLHEHLTRVGAKHQWRVYEGKEHKLGHVFNIQHSDWAESVEANEDIIAFFNSKRTR